MSLAPNRLLRQWKARLGIRRRLRELTAELTTEFPQLEELIPSPHAGGFDSIYFLRDISDQYFGVLRLNNPYQKRKVVHTDLPRRSPPPAERIDREWSAYSTLAPLWISPRPLWRTTDAMVCSYSAHPSFRTAIEQGLANLDAVLIAVFNAIGQMHEANVVHLDLSPGNVLVCPHTYEIALIDFEYQTVAGRSIEDDCHFDWRHFVRQTRKRAAIAGRGTEIEATIGAAIQASRYRQRIEGALGAEVPSTVP